MWSRPDRPVRAAGLRRAAHGRNLVSESRRRWVERRDALTGWRLWNVARDGDAYRLRSPVRTEVWPVGEPLVAECTGSDLVWGVRGSRHEAPSPDCRCGVYGGTYSGLRSFLNATFLPPAEAAVLGRTSLWGTVIDERSGWRAQYAYPERLAVPTLLRDAMAIAEDLEDYGVPVVMLNAAEMFAALHPTATLRPID
jgi:hypothetical protein